ncbi:uncharacterized protein DNG_08831 [Cephalotrichum gorgonifer]|uniref:Uncharacterized protein n=1 Tax=Cephalotrichum gorgonifer TaxID=2041049 RepID=A0AAE8N4W1_9PEZI|nr:uncharacterized protein DNG_08831 [Cephalotrichum gorgonifer]
MDSQGRSLPREHSHIQQYPVGGEYNLNPPAPYQEYGLAYSAPQMPMGASYQSIILPEPGFWDLSFGYYGGTMGPYLPSTCPSEQLDILPVTGEVRPSHCADKKPAKDSPAHQTNVSAVKPAGSVDFFSSGPGRVSFPDGPGIAAVPRRARGYPSAGNGSVLGNSLAGPSNGNAAALYPQGQWASAVNAADPVGSRLVRGFEGGRGALVEIDANGSGRVSKRGRGRPKGSKNKPKPAAAITTAHTAGTLDGSGVKSKPPTGPVTTGGESKPPTSPTANGSKSMPLAGLTASRGKSIPPASPTANGIKSMPPTSPTSNGGKSQHPTSPATNGGKSGPPTGPATNGGKSRPPISPATDGVKSRSPTRPASKGGKTRPPTGPPAEPSIDWLTEWLRTVENKSISDLGDEPSTEGLPTQEDDSLSDLGDEPPAECLPTKEDASLSALGDEPPTECLRTLEDEPSAAWLRIPATDPSHAERIRGPLEPSWIGRRDSEYALHPDHVRDHIPGLCPRSRNPS